LGHLIRKFLINDFSLPLAAIGGALFFIIGLLTSKYVWYYAIIGFILGVVFFGGLGSYWKYKNLNKKF
jgi:hypothetical protein